MVTLTLESTNEYYLTNNKLKDYLPGNFHCGFPKKSIGSVSSSNYSSAALLTIPYIYITSMGENLTDASKIAILAAMNISDELFGARRGEYSFKGEVESKVKSLIERIEEITD